MASSPSEARSAGQRRAAGGPSHLAATSWSRARPTSATSTISARRRSRVTTSWSTCSWLRTPTSSASSCSTPTAGSWRRWRCTPRKTPTPASSISATTSEIDGRMLPARIEVRHGDDFAQVYQMQAVQHSKPAAAEIVGRYGPLATAAAPSGGRSPARLSQCCACLLVRQSSAAAGRLVCRRDRRRSAEDGQDLRRRRRSRLEAYQSGFLISAEGHILTACSYVLDTDYITVTLDDGRKFEAKLVGADPRLELAVLKIDAAESAALRSGRRRAGRRGQPGAGLQQPVRRGHRRRAGRACSTARSR